MTDDMPPLTREQVREILGLGTIRDPQPPEHRPVTRKYLRRLEARDRRKRWRVRRDRLRSRIAANRLTLAERAYKLISGCDLPDRDDW